jgi:hypothetical protein
MQPLNAEASEEACSADIFCANLIAHWPNALFVISTMSGPEIFRICRKHDGLFQSLDVTWAAILFGNQTLSFSALQVGVERKSVDVVTVSLVLYRSFEFHISASHHFHMSCIRLRL